MDKYIKADDGVQAIYDWMVKGEMQRELAETAYAGDQSFLAGAMWGAAMAAIHMNTDTEAADVLTVASLEREIRKRMHDNPHSDVRIKLNHMREWESMLNMIYRMVEKDVREEV